MTAKKTTKKTATKAPAKKRTAKPGRTYVALVIDRSGSMGLVQKAALSGINEQINVLKSQGDNNEVYVTFVQFDDVIEVLYDKKPASELVPLNENQYVPRGTTAMYDAVWTAINRLETGVKPTKKDAFLVVVISDGMENASKEATSATLASRIKALQETGQWTFSYMLSNQDLSVVSKTLGVDMGNISAFDSLTAQGTADGFGQAKNATSNYLSMRGSGLTSTRSFYSDVTSVPTDRNS